MRFTPVLLFMIFALVGCGTNPYDNTYPIADTQKIQQVYYGIVISTAPVNITGESTGIGTITGAAVGGILGSKIGRGTGSAIATIGGGLLGGVAGNKAAQKLTRHHGVNIIIKLDSGSTIAIVQEVNPAMLFKRGQRVQIHQQGNTARVMPI